ncbi:MAG: DUF58 domain-containing protein [bacterium]|nr:DUF58 domain-containing protein [bacterium]
MHGFAVEFAGHRQYVPGDDVKHLDWRVYFRQDRHVIKQYEMETNLVCHLMLDVSESMRYGQADTQKLLYAARLAITLGHLIVEQSDKVSLALFDEEIRDRLKPSNTMAQVLQMATAVDQIEPTRKTQMGPALLDLAARAGRRGIVIILSDLLVEPDDLVAGLQRLRYDGHEVVLMQVMHHDELAFDFSGTIRFLGIEMDEQVLARPNDIRDAYLDALGEHNARLEEICNANRCERVLCDTSRNMGNLFADYLQRRQVSHRRW